MIIYPKLCENLNGLEYIKEYVERNNGIEIQLLNIEEPQKKTYEAVKRLKTEIPQSKLYMLQEDLYTIKTMKC